MLNAMPEVWAYDIQIIFFKRLSIQLIKGFNIVTERCKAQSLVQQDLNSSESEMQHKVMTCIDTSVIINGTMIIPNF